jgi:hypothetical protein
MTVSRYGDGSNAEGKAKVRSECLRGYEKRLFRLILEKIETLAAKSRDQKTHKSVLLYASM